eukprot:CAMPEP_0197177088 /NCGR_PEP_ID=MMETSP1423-20130617/2813_1 /TAXON_ID=476441 /ORGANISM="Pseudo-nitzschia heimii, Strain UNC1101" /LENGTH=259 /DNA_ID=CAMNT_0042626579 /DNA_START=254 /DNA_END=1033 /DNA_ORIENTATION=-
MSPNTTHIPCATEWPALATTNIASSQEQNVMDSDWELISDANEGSEDKSFDLVEPILADIEKVNFQTASSTKKSGAIEGKPHCLKHAQSTPDFGSLASSSMVMVSRPPSVILSQSSWSGTLKISFRDAIMKEKDEEVEGQDTTGKGEEGKVQQPKIVRKKPTFVVKPIRRFSSTGDLQSLARIVENGDSQGDNDPYNKDLVVGDTDAELYYSRKAQGKLGRKNGRKIRPDEAKRLQITMDKKDAQRQRQRQQASESKKR